MHFTVEGGGKPPRGKERGREKRDSRVGEKNGGRGGHVAAFAAADRPRPQLRRKSVGESERERERERERGAEAAKTTATKWR